MANPNEYNDEAFLQGSEKLEDAMWFLWEAGADFEDIQGEFDNHLANLKAEEE